MTPVLSESVRNRSDLENADIWEPDTNYFLQLAIPDQGRAVRETELYG